MILMYVFRLNKVSYISVGIGSLIVRKVYATDIICINANEMMTQ